MVRDIPQESRIDPSINTNYELMTWSCSLGSYFPFLFGPHVKTSYHRHYLLWRLSKLMGERLSDFSIDFDQEILDSPENTIERILTFAEIENVEGDKLIPLIVKPRTGEWLEHKEEAWFESIEKECEELLEKLGLIQNFGKIPIAEIIEMNQSIWNYFGEKAGNAATEEALKLFAISRKEDLVVRNELKLINEQFHEEQLKYKEQLKKIDRFRFWKRILPQ